jgi:Leucine-rich repeat (LRR) protein
MRFIVPNDTIIFDCKDDEIDELVLPLSIEYVYLNNNSLLSIQPSLDKLINLKLFKYNDLCGDICIFDCNNISKLPHCTHIFIKNMNDKILIPNTCTNLTILSSQINDLVIPDGVIDFNCSDVGNITSIRLPDSLEYLNCRTNPIKNLRLPKNIACVDCSYCKLQNIEAVEDLTNLLVLDMRYNSIIKCDIKFPNTLEELNIYGNYNIRFKYLDFIFKNSVTICAGDYLETLCPGFGHIPEEYVLGKIKDTINNGELYIDLRNIKK